MATTKKPTKATPKKRGRSANRDSQADERESASERQQEQA